MIPINHIKARLPSFVRSLFVVYPYTHMMMKMAEVAPNTDMIELSSKTKNTTDNTAPLIAL
jgi:hypothetical protein